jgi:hypothetical protein
MTELACRDTGFPVAVTRLPVTAPEGATMAPDGLTLDRVLINGQFHRLLRWRCCHRACRSGKIMQENITHCRLAESCM